MSDTSGPQTTYTEPQTHGGRAIVLEARAWRLSLPFGGLVWNRPAAVHLGPPGESERVPIRDVTRRAQIALLAVALLCLLAGRQAGRR